MASYLSAIRYRQLGIIFQIWRSQIGPPKSSTHILSDQITKRTYIFWESEKFEGFKTNWSIVSQDEVNENQVIRFRVAKTQQPDAERLTFHCETHRCDNDKRAFAETACNGFWLIKYLKYTIAY